MRFLSRHVGVSLACCLVSCLVLTVASSGADVIVFGPQTYSGTGRPLLRTATFNAQTAGSGYTLHVTNKGVSVALVIVNGRIVLRPSDFISPPQRTGRDDDPWLPEWDRMQREWRADRNDRTVTTIDKPVTLLAGRNEITVAFISRTGTSFTLQIASSGQTPAPTITAIPSPAPNAAGWNRSNVTVSFACTNATTCPGPVTATNEGAGQVVSGTAIGPGGTATASSTLNIDKTPPVVTATPAPVANSNGWNGTPVVTTFAATDVLSGVASGSLTAPITLSVDGANQSVTGQAIDRAGNVGTITRSGINIDQTRPAVAVTLSPAPNANGWNSGPVTAHFACTDALSGIATCPPDQVVAADGASQTVNGTATDRAGNTVSVTSTPFSIDHTPPSISVGLSGPIANGAYTGAVTAHFTCGDALSGVASCPVDQVFSTAGANQSATGQASDRADNTASATSGPFTIVLSMPVISVKLSPAPNANGWNNTSVTAHFTCTENGTQLAGCPPDRMISTEGANQTVAGSVTDPAGQTASVTSDSFSIDRSAPGITPALSPAPNANGWNNTAVTAHFNCTDALSGIASCTSDQFVGTDGSNQTVAGSAVDRAGNSASATTAAFNIDRTPPTISVTLTGPFSNGVYTGPVTGHFACTDTLSQVATCPPDQTVSNLGTNLTVSGTAVDRAGNSASKTSDPFTIVGLVVSDFSPKSAPAGSVINVTGAGFTGGGAPRVTLVRRGGGTIDAPVSSATNATLSFVVPTGAATGNIIVTVGSRNAASATALTIASSSTFTLVAAPDVTNLIQGQSVTFAVSVAGANGFAQPVSLSVTANPGGLTASFDPPEITAGRTAVLTVAGANNQTVGTSTLTIQASATLGGIPINQTAALTINVQAATTAFAGRIVVADAFETPIAGVTVKMLGQNGNGGTTSCSGTTISDPSGNFALTGLGPGCVGPQLVGYNGLTSTSPVGKFAGVNLQYTLQAGQVTVSPVLVHLPRIDDKETFYVHQNYGQDQTFVYQSIPGLAVTVYAGTTFTLEDGSRPEPFPLVAVQVPVDRLPDQKPPVPTMLSAFIVAFQPANAVASLPAAVFYPNTLNTPPNINMTLMTLDPTRGKMLPYGTATVSKGGTQIVPDLDPSHPGHRYGIVHFDWHGPMPPPVPPPPSPDPVNPIDPSPGGGGCGGDGADPPTDGPCSHDGGCEDCIPVEGSCECLNQGPNPIDIASGLETIVHTDLSFGGARGSVALRRYFRTMSIFGGPFGIGSHHNYGYRLDTVNFQTADLINLVTPAGNRFPFTKEQTLKVPEQPPASNELRNYTNPAMVGAVMTVLPAEVQLRWKDGTVYRFVQPNAQFTPQLESITDRNSNKITITRNANNPNQVTQITDPTGRSLNLTYDGANRIVSASDPIGRVVSYTYNAQGTLETVTDPEGGVTKYEYDTQNHPIKETNARGIVIAQTTYESSGRVATQTQADGGVFRFTYFTVNDTIPLSPVMAVVVQDPLGRKRHSRFTPTGFRMGTSLIGSSQSVTLERDVLTNHIVARRPIGTDSGKEAFTYDGRGNRLTYTDGTGGTTTYTYESTFNRVTSIKDATGATTFFTYDSHGNLVSRRDPNGHTTSYGYDANGLLTRTTDALGRLTRFEYDTFGNLTKITDALGAATQLRYDGASRLVETLDSLGRQTQTTYDGVGRVIKQTDAKGQITAFAYNPTGNLIAVTDARGKTTKFAYDALNHLSSRTDPLGHADSRTYDSKGNLASFTDRRGQTSSFTYDSLNRLVQEQYAEGSLVTRGYDAFGRLASVTEAGPSPASFGFQYDLAGRIAFSSGPFGAVQYQRDAVGRVLTRQVSGQPAQTHTYDPAGNLLYSALSGASVSFVYDAANELAAINRSNGVSSNYVYDPVGRVLSIVHARGAAALQSLAYTYDGSGARISQGTIAQPLATQAAIASYDDANRLIQRGAVIFAYDANGNLLSEAGPSGTTNYTWDSRNRLTSVETGNGQTSQLQYDFTGNLIHQSSVGSTANVANSFVLDSITNVAYQQSSDGSQLSVLTGRSIDSHLATVSSGGLTEFGLSDAINSTVVTADQTGILKGQFTYELFGETKTSGSSYPFQYTGRVSVTNSLYYYRARFYSAATGRFISEDPIGFGGGVSLYAYVRNNPVYRTDPFGLTDMLTGPLQSSLDTQTPTSTTTGCSVGGRFVQCMVVGELSGRPLSWVADAAVGLCPIAETPITATVCIGGLLYKATEIPRTVIDAGQCYQDAQSQCAGCALMNNFQWTLPQ